MQQRNHMNAKEIANRTSVITTHEYFYRLLSRTLTHTHKVKRDHPINVMQCKRQVVG